MEKEYKFMRRYFFILWRHRSWNDLLILSLTLVQIMQRVIEFAERQEFVLVVITNCKGIDLLLAKPRRKPLSAISPEKERHTFLVLSLPFSLSLSLSLSGRTPGLQPSIWTHSHLINSVIVHSSLSLSFTHTHTNTSAIYLYVGLFVASIRRLLARMMSLLVHSPQYKLSKI
jgi:hypothetical protein